MALPRSVELVWHGVNDEANLRQFLASPVPWAELDVNLDPEGRELILRHDGFAQLPRWEGEVLLPFAGVLSRLLAAGKSIKIDFKVGGAWIDRIVAVVDEQAIPQHRLWLNAGLDVWGEATVRTLAARYPRAVIQIPLSSFRKHLGDRAQLAQRITDAANWGVNRFSVGWRYPDVPGIMQQLKAAGYETNIYGVADLDEFLQAVALEPTSVTADFNFPQWHMYGRGSGHQGRYYEYELVTVQAGAPAAT